MEEDRWPRQWARRVAGAQTELHAQDPWPLPIMFSHLQFYILQNLWKFGCSTGLAAETRFCFIVSVKDSQAS